MGCLGYRQKFGQMIRPPCRTAILLYSVLSVSAGGLKMNERRKYAILFAATILAARKLNDSGSTPWAIESAINDAIGKAERILVKIDQRWPARGGQKRVSGNWTEDSPLSASVALTLPSSRIDGIMRAARCTVCALAYSREPSLRSLGLRACTLVREDDSSLR